MKVFLTGATGAFGTAAVRALLERRHDVRAVARTDDKRSHSCVHGEGESPDPWSPRSPGAARRCWRYGEEREANDRDRQDLSAGRYEAMPAEMRHFGLARTAAVVQVHGRGPFTSSCVNPADDPRQKKK